MARVGVIGEALIDVLPFDGDLLIGRPGGSPANVAVALARLGVPTTFFGRTSTDSWGERLRDHLRAENIRLEDAPIGGEPTAMAFASMSADGQATYRFLWEGTADRCLTLAELPPTLAVDVLHIGSVACVLEPGASAIADLAERERGRCLVTFDPNPRPSLELDPTSVRRRLTHLAGMAHVIKTSDEDLAFLFPKRDIDETARSLLASETTRMVVVTRGSNGASMWTSPGDEIAIPVDSGGRVVDTIGAGDTFMAGLIAGLAEHNLLDTEKLERITVDDAREVGSLAATAAGIVVTRAGADPPHRDELTR